MRYRSLITDLINRVFLAEGLWRGEMMTSPPETKALDATTVNYFYGRLSRHEAERILMDKGCCDGLFLLRLSLTKPDDYALAICSGRRSASSHNHHLRRRRLRHHHHH